MSLLFHRGVSRLIHTSRSFSTSASLSSVTPGSSETTLFGTVPPHISYILLQASEPPASFPSRLHNPLQRALQLEVRKWGGMVNLVWHGPAKPDKQDSATVFSLSGGRLDVPSINLDNIQDIAEKLRNHAYGPLSPETCKEIRIYVCTHGARDCRCGDRGGAVVRALHNEVARLTQADPNGVANRVRIGEVGHVGGHQYAANMLIYPHGEWLGMLGPEDVPAVLSKVLQSPIEPFGRGIKPIVPHLWRGRMGLSKEEQTILFKSQCM